MPAMHTALPAALLLVLVSSAAADPEAIHVASGGLAELPSGPLSTKTVLGFLDFTTTVSDTVIKFTSQGGPGNTPAFNVQSSAILGSDFSSNNQQQNQQSSFIEVTSPHTAPGNEIQPSPVKKTSINEGVTHFPNGVVEIDGGEDITVYDKFSSERELTANEGFSVEDVSTTDRPEYYYNDEEEEEELTTRKPSNSFRRRPNVRQSASQAYKERLRKRVEKEKAKLQLAELANKKSPRRSNVKKYGDVETEEAGTEAPRFKSRTRTRSFAKAQSRSFETDEVFTEEESEETQGRGFGSRSGRQDSHSRSRGRSSFRRNSFNTQRSSEAAPSSTAFSPRSSSSFRSRFKSRFEKPSSSSAETPSTSSTPAEKPQRKQASSFNSEKTEETKNPVVIKKFNKFKRPDYRKTLLNKLFEKRPDIKSRVAERREKDKQKEEEERKKEENVETDELVAGDEGDLAFPDDHESSPSALVASIVDDEDILQEIDNEEIRLERLLTTLEVSTAYPAELPSSYLEVATIRSPYTFNIEENEKSTRFITITTSVTKALDIAPSSTFTQPPVAETSSRPLFDTDAIPAPENILASTQLPVLQSSAESEDVSVLAPLTLTSALHQATPPLETVTESTSTVETLTKKSLLPVIFQDSSSVLTLTQTYSVTRIVTAVKTVPPMELYEFNPQANFADFDLLFEEAGSERRESLLPGELEFSDQDNFGLEGPSIVKVKPPQHFHEDIDLLGSKFFETDRHSNPVPAPNIESSFGSPNTRLGAGLATTPTQTQATPSLPDNGLAALGITPEQLLYLQLLQNPLAALGIGGAFQQPQVITETSPVYKTESVIETSVIKLNFGNREIFTTITNTNGVTTKTDYITATKTINSGGLGGLTAAFGGLGQLGGLQQQQPQLQQQPQQQPQHQEAVPALGLGGLLPSYTVVSSPVTRDTVITETLTEEFKIRFRNVETFTTITSTQLVSTQITSFITKTERVLPTANPLAGLLG